MVRRASARQGGKVRRGLANVEAVLVTAVGLPAAVFLLLLGVRACKHLFVVVGVSVGWPHL